MVRVFRLTVLAGALVALAAGSAYAQLSTGEIFGKATDSSNAPVPGVTVTLEGPALQRAQIAITSSTGAYRFPQIPIGTYTVTFGLSGFKTVKREGVVIQTAFSAEINAKLEVSTVQETVTVSGAAPVVDTKNVSTGATFNREVLDAVPTARDPWVVLNMVPGVIVNGVNVGGSTSGQQPGFSTRGVGSSQAMWNIDGGTTTDMAATGASAQYYDFDAFEEIQVTTGGSDVSVMTSGININLVTRSGSNVFKGTGRVGYDGSQMQSNNVNRALFESGGSSTRPLSGAPLKYYAEYGGELGGPIRRNRLWWWGALAQQKINSSVLGFFKETPECSPPPSDYEHLKDTQACLHDDKTQLTNANGKLNYQLNAANKLAFLYNFSDKTRNTRGANSTHPPETTYRQYNSRNPLHAGYNLKWTWILTDKLVFDTTFEDLQGGFSLDFQNPDTQFNLQPLYDDDTNTWHRSHDQYITERPTIEVKTDSSYFLSNMLGGDHALKFGFRYHSSPWNTFDHYGGYAIALINSTGSSTGKYAYLERDENLDMSLAQYGAYLQDSYSKGRLRLNLGLRWDYQDDKANPSSVVAVPLAPELLPAYDFGGLDAGIAWNDVSPRLSATYDLFGTGKTVLKGTYAFYYNQAGLFSDNLNPNRGVEVRVEWDDKNGDQFIQSDEISHDPADARVTFGNIDLSTGAPVPSTNTIDPGLKNSRTREGIVGIEHELMANFGVGLNYIYRHFDRGSFTRIIGETADMWEEVAWTPTADDLATLPPGTPTTGWSYWRVKADAPVLANNNNRANAPSSVYGVYRGVELTARKRLSNRWQMNGSFTWNDDRNYGSTDFNHTNENKQLGYNGAGNRFVVKLNGSYQLPGGWNAGVNANIQDGSSRTIQYRASIDPRYRSRTTSSQTSSTVTWQVDPSGTTHLPTLKMVDAMVDKNFSLGSGRRLNLSITAFNLFNVATIRGYSSNRLDQSTFDRVSSIVAPRIVRIMARVNF